MCWHVDDNKISHDSPSVVSKIIGSLEAKFGKMSVSRGDTHDFLGMQLKFHKNGQLEIDMKSHMHSAIEESGMEDSLKPVSTPARSNLFNIDAKSPLLGNAKKKIFHSIVYKLLYVSLRGRRDIHLTTIFLASRVRDTTNEDYTKLRRLLCYLKGTINLTAFLGAENLHTMVTPVDVSYATHDDFKSHTGGASTYGIGLTSSKSSKQKLNTTSSTEAELVGVADCLPKILSHRLFIKGTRISIET